MILTIARAWGDHAFSFDLVCADCDPGAGRISADMEDALDVDIGTSYLSNEGLVGIQ